MTIRQLRNYATNSDYNDHATMFVMRHKAHSMSAQHLTNTSSSKDVWFVDSRASNHMASHEDWFRELRKPDQPKYIKTRDDMTHPIQHVENVPFGYDGKQTYLKNVLQVPTITKNLVSLGQIVEQGMQVRFNNEGCFIEKESQLVVHGRKKGRMFILKWN